jgi:peptide/nickel transport system substrate-binding protein
VRAAIALAIDKAAIVRAAYQDLAIPASSPVPPTQWGHYQDPGDGGPDLALARTRLAARAKAGAIDLGRTYRLFVPSTPRPYLPDPDALARALRTNLEAVGLHVEVVMQPIERHRADTGLGLHDLAVFGWTGDIDDPDDYLSLLSSRGIGPTWSRNIAFYREPAVDDLLDQARRENRRPERERLYAELQQRLARDLPWVPLAHAQSAIAARDDLSGIFLGHGGVIDYGSIQRNRP